MESLARPLIEAGRPRLGWLEEPVSIVNYRDANLRSAMGKPRGAFYKRQAFNQFLFLGVTGPEWVWGAALVDLFWVGNGFVYWLPFDGSEKAEHSWVSPLAAGIHLMQTPDSGTYVGRAPGRELRFEIMSDRLQCRVYTPKIVAELEIMLSTPPLRVCSRAGYDGWSFTQKRNGLPVQGRLVADGQVLELTDEYRAGIDFSGGFMRRETVWQWASINGVLDDGRAFGLNLATGINESGTTENVCWIGAERYRLPPVMFHFDRDAPEQSWRVADEDGRVALTFRPAGERRERVNAGILASNFVQYGGHWSGQLHLPDGVTVGFSGLGGFAEDHYARW